MPASLRRATGTGLRGRFFLRSLNSLVQQMPCEHATVPSVDGRSGVWRGPASWCADGQLLVPWPYHALTPPGGGGVSPPITITARPPRGPTPRSRHVTDLGFGVARGAEHPVCSTRRCKRPNCCRPERRAHFEATAPRKKTLQRVRGGRGAAYGECGAGEASRGERRPRGPQSQRGSGDLEEEVRRGPARRHCSHADQTRLLLT